MPRRQAPEIEIECRGLHGGVQRFPAREFRFRPAAYGVALRRGRILLGRSAFHGQLEIPGGAVHPWETMEEGLCREFFEETGIRPRPLRFLHFSESFFSFFRYPFHSLRFYFLVDLPADAEPKPDQKELTDLCWVDLDRLPEKELTSEDLAAIRTAQSACKEDPR